MRQDPLSFALESIRSIYFGDWVRGRRRHWMSILIDETKWTITVLCTTRFRISERVTAQERHRRSDNMTDWSPEKSLNLHSTKAINLQSSNQSPRYFLTHNYPRQISQWAKGNYIEVLSTCLFHRHRNTTNDIIQTLAKMKEASDCMELLFGYREVEQK